MPVVSGIDISGSGAGSTPLPGLAYNCLNRGCGVSDLNAAITNWNTTYAGKLDATGKKIPVLTLPSNFSLGRPFNSQDARLTKTFTFRERYKLSLFGEMFNIFNYSNYSGYSTDPSNSTGFQIATQRVSQVFGSGGARAVQVGGRVTF
jgi:hypothetical protein